MVEPMENKYSHIDRRQALRKRSRSTMRFHILGEKNPREHEVTTADLSAKSVLFETPELLSIGTDIAMELVIPSLEKPIKAEGRINRIGEQERGDVFQYCLLFEKITQEDQRILAEYIQLIDIDNLLRLALERNASDVHLVANKPPIFRMEGKLIPLDMLPLSPTDLKSMILTMMTGKQQILFEEQLDLNFSYFTPEGQRFRVNAHHEKGCVEAALRIIPAEIKTFEDLGLPQVLNDYVQRNKGLFIVTGPTSSGKTTSLATMVDTINRERNCMVVGIEDPMEYVHHSKSSIIKQREVGTDTLSFNHGLKQVLRQDPDVIFIGDMRDAESASMAITAAETGHLVLTAMDTSDTVECINRIVAMFPSDQHDQMRNRLAGCLNGIMAQMLLPRKDGTGRVAATELLGANSTMTKMIREGKHDQVETYVKSGLQVDFHSMDDSLKALVQAGLVEDDLARGLMKSVPSVHAGMVPL